MQVHLIQPIELLNFLFKNLRTAIKLKWKDWPFSHAHQIRILMFSCHYEKRRPEQQGGRRRINEVQKATSSQSSSRKLGKNTAVTSRIPHIKQFKSKEQCFTIIMAFSSFGGLIFSLISCLLINWIEFVQSIPRSRGGASSENGHLGKSFQICTQFPQIVFLSLEKNTSYINCTVYIRTISSQDLLSS